MVGDAARPGACRAGSRSTSRPPSYQCFAQTPSVARGPAGQDSIASSNGTPSGVAQRGADRPRVVSTSGRRPRGARAGRSAHARRSRPAAGSPRSASVGLAADLARSEATTRGRVADQEARCVSAAEPVAADLRQQVVGHVLLVEDRLAAGDGADQRRRRPAASRSALAAMTSSRPGWSSPVRRR